jgi:hypothetical protein
LKITKTLTKRPRKTIKNQKKKGQIKITIIIIEKKNKNLIGRIKIKATKTFFTRKNEQKYEIKIKMTELKIIIYTN